jgi:hypothetical protein
VRLYILHHAAERETSGQRMMEEFERHGDCLSLGGPLSADACVGEGGYFISREAVIVSLPRSGPYRYVRETLAFSRPNSLTRLRRSRRVTLRAYAKALLTSTAVKLT